LCRRSRLRRGQVFERRVQRVVLDGAEHGLDFAVAIDQHQGGLGWDVEAVVDNARVVADLGKRQIVAVDEVLERRFISGPGDAVEVDLVGPLLAGRFDRRGFTVAGNSSRRPEPERDRATCGGGAIERSTADEGCGESQRFRDRRIESRVCRCGDALVRIVRSTRDQRRRYDADEQPVNDRAPTGLFATHSLGRRSSIMSASRRRGVHVVIVDRDGEVPGSPQHLVEDSCSGLDVSGW